MFFNLFFKNGNEIFDIAKDDLIDVLEWQNIEISKKEEEELQREITSKRVIEILKKYCDIVENKEEEYEWKEKSKRRHSQ